MSQRLREPERVSGLIIKGRAAIYAVFTLFAWGSPAFCAPTLIAPQDTVYISTVSPTFFWSTTTPNYQLQVDDNSNFLSPVIDIITSSISYTAPMVLAHGVTYYWQVKDSAWSGSYSFNIDTTPPAASSYGHISSTGGVMAESQFNTLISGVTVQINTQDVLSGLAVTIAAYPAGGHGIMYSKDAGQSWLTENMSLSYDGAQQKINSLAVYNGKLYAGQGYDTGTGDVYVFDGNTWSLCFDGSQEGIYSLAVYNGKLYAGQGHTSAGDGDIYVFDGSTWSLSYDGAQEYINSLAVYNGKLYAGQGSGAGDGDIYVFDGNTWTKSFEGVQEYINSLAVYNGKLYAGQGSGTGDGDVYVFDGNTWIKSFEGAQEYINSLAVYNGKLYAGQGLSTGDGDIYVFDGNTWIKSFEGAQEYINSLAVYNGKLCAGQGSGVGDGDIYVFDGNTWTKSFEGAQEYMHSLAVYNGKLYAGQGLGTGDGDVFSFSPTAVSSVTGADGSTGPETLSAALSLAASTNTQTCGGAAPCGATNQVKFFGTDLAGNVKMAGPYAILTYQPNPSAIEVSATYSTGAWVNASSITFTSGFQQAAYYRYAWDNSQAYEWSFAEPVWSSGPLELDFPSDGDWYLHVLPYNILDSSGPPVDIGPFNVDRTVPMASSYGHISSTGGVMAESQFNTLLSGVTVQINTQDVLSGLAVTIAAYPAGGHGVMYSKDAGQSWLTENMSLSYNGTQEYINSLAVYNGKLYAGQGYSTGDGDIYVFDGNTWTKSFEGAQEYINSLAVYNGKLYAGQGYSTGDGDIYVFDGNTWSLSYDGGQKDINSMAVYNGKLYAGQGGGTGAGDGDIFVFDGNAWSLSYNGAQECINSLAVYNGKLYAGQGSGAGDGDIYVFDGNTWIKSFEGAQEYINSLAVYNGKLYAGQGYNTGDGDVYVFDGNTWNLSYDGAQEYINSLAVYNGRLYAGQGSGTGDGDIYSFDGSTWTLTYNGNEEYISSLAAYNGILYAGQGSGLGNGDVLSFSPAAVSYVTGADGSTGLETLSAALNLAASTNTQTCGGAAPCGATNQVRFFGTDLAGNVKTAGPYAVLTYQPNPTAIEVFASLSTGVWINASSITFTSAFQQAAYYRYAWDNSPAYAWNFSEPAWWSPGALGLEFTGDGDWYLHVLPYNILDSSGPPVAIGPFNVDRTVPAASSYGHISSTGGFLSETQLNPLLAGVTVQISVQDILSGLAVTTGAYPSGGHGVLYSIDAGQSWADGNMALSFDGAQEYVHSLAVYNGKLYAGQGNSYGDGNVYVFDGNVWRLSFNGTQESILALAVYNGRLYAGQGSGTGDADIYVFDGNTWSLSFDGARQAINSLAVYNGKLYAGQGSSTGDGDIYVFDGNTWSLSYDGAREAIYSLAVYNGKLYAGHGDTYYDVYAFDGNAWVKSLEGAGGSIKSLAVYNGRLYAGAGGNIYAFDGNAWSLNYDGAQEYINSLAVYNGRLYAGQGSGTGDGDIYSFDGSTWTLTYNGNEEYINSLAAYNGKLYAGQGSGLGNGDVLAFSPAAVSYVTGADGSTGLETLSAALNLAASTNTQTCGGSAPCGATNQVRFFGTDLAGNVKTAGPYAVLTYQPNPSAIEVLTGLSTGVWVNASSVAFTSGFEKAFYYRYAWDNSPAYEWSFAEPVWASGPLELDFPGDGVWYLHVLPYNIFDSSGPPVAIGPFNADRTVPAASSYGHISSTGGFISESQIDSLLAGVTVQINMQDVLAGLALTTGAYPSGGHGVLYSTDAGKSWADGNMALSFDSTEAGIYSLAVYDGKLYAGQGENYGAGDIYVFDGNAWSLSFDGELGSVRTMAVYNGRLYAGQRGYFSDQGSIHVFDGNTWTLSFNTMLEGIYSMAVYNGRLYAIADRYCHVYDGNTWATLPEAPVDTSALAVYNGRLYAGQYNGGIYAFDGNAWSLSYAGTLGYIASMAVYNGRLYAGLSGATGDGDIYVFDGHTWSLSFNGAQDGIESLAVYNGKLYAGQSLEVGAGDIYVFDGNIWSRSFDSALTIAVLSLAAYNGKLYAGQGYDGDDVFAFSPAAISSATGADGSTGFETFSAALSLAVSTNTETCGGAAPCGATNQVKFFGTDLAGNVRTAGPYAILTYQPNPSAIEVAATYSTGAWVNASSITFTSGFQQAAYYRYAWDNSPAYAWNFSETVWSPGALGLEFPGDGAWYLHVLPYNLVDSSGAPVDLGPFNADRALPAASSYGNISSTGGFLSETQFNSLLAGVTVQINMQDALAGLAVTAGGYASGGHRVLYSRDAGKTWADGNMALSFDGAQEYINSLAVYNGKLYAGQGGGAGDGDVYVFDGNAWTKSFEGAGYDIYALAVYDGRLYAAQGGNAGDGDVYVFDGNTWSLSLQYDAYDTYSLAVYNGKLYAGSESFTGEANIHVYDGKAWRLTTGPLHHVKALAVYNGKLYAGQGRYTGDGDVYVFDGHTWSLGFDGAQEYINSLAVYNGRLYAGQGSGTGDGDIYVFDGNTWSLSYNGAQEYINSLAVYNGRLYAGQGSATGDGDLYVFDGGAWTLAHDGEQEYINSLAVYNGKLYAGQGSGTGDGDVFGFSLAAVSTITGADGSTGLETLSAALNLVASTNTQTCGGAAPCGATNQVKFFGTDLAGNLRIAGPYAVLAYQPDPSAVEVAATYSTGAWLNASSVAFSSAFQQAAYYRYAWDNSPAYEWGFSEPVWASGALLREFSSDNAWYLHVLPYNIFDSSGQPADLGPFNVDRAVPAASSYGHISSTGGFLSESQIDPLLAGVTVQINMQDVLAGLAVTTGAYPAGGHGVLYSVDAGQSWADASMAISFDGADSNIAALSVYNGKLYAGQEGGAGDGDVYVFDGNTWSRSFDGAQEYIDSLAVYNGKLYAGQGTGTGDGDIYVFDGNTWSLSYNGTTEDINALAVYNGKLYAGLGSVAGDGDIFVFDGNTWSRSFDGAQEAIYALAVYNGKLYAGQGASLGDGDIYAFDGNAWTLSYNGTFGYVFSLAVYNGKLYAGLGYSDGYGDIYAFDGNAWSLSYDGAASGIFSFAVNNGKLYAGQGGVNGTGDVFVFDGNAWSKNFNGPGERMSSLAVYNGKLYGGQGYSSGSGDVLAFSPLAISSVTGADGATGAQTLSAALNLAASTNTQACGGAAPCGATNQVKFFGTDLGGNVKIAGPYAILTYTSEPLAGYIAATYSTGAWVNAGSITFTSAFQQAAYYRYAWDNSPAYDWNFSETVWSPGALGLEFPGDGAWYLHVLPYNIFDSSGAPVDIGPFNVERAVPAASAYGHISSTGGLLGEGQSNGLISGVTVQLQVGDLLAGLLVSDEAVPGDSGLPTGGYGVRYSTDAGRTWAAESMSLSFNGRTDAVTALAVYNGKLYAGQGDDNYWGDGNVYMYDGAAWSKSFDGDEYAIRSFAVYEGKLYAGQSSYGDGGKIYVFDGNTWEPGFTPDTDAAVNALAVYNGRLYAGLYGYNTGDGDVYSFDGNTWRLSYDGAQEGIESLAVYNGRLYAGQSEDTGNGDIYVFDGNAWNLSFDGAENAIGALAVYNGRLYAGQYGYNPGDGAVYVFDGTGWELSLQAPGDGVASLAVYKGQLYAGLGYDDEQGNGDIYAFDGGSWRRIYDGPNVGVRALAAYKGGLYAGQYGWDVGYGQVFRFLQPAAALTGQDGATGEETLSAALNLARSTNTETCGGAAPCGATNQVIFSATDRAGNVVSAGPYAVMTAPAPSAGDIAPDRAAGAWYNTSTFTFSSAFPTAAYYRCAWDTSGSHDWTYTEPQWLSASGAVAFEAASPGAGYYLHALPYDNSDSSGAPRHIGPFRFENGLPAVSEFASVSSTGGFLSESQLNDLASAVTVRLKTQDLLSGLAVSSAAAPGETPVPAGGYWVRYSTDAGKSWAAGAAALSFAGITEAVSALAVYDGRLYAGQGSTEAGEGDVYVYDGAAWSRSFNGSKTGIMALAVYSGKLYAAESGENVGEGDVYEYDGVKWDISYNGEIFNVYMRAFAVYNGRLYAAQYGGNYGDGDIYEFDGRAWRLSFDGNSAGFSSLAVYNGRLYAGRGVDEIYGEGDVYVFDGNTWALSLDGAGVAIRSLAVYNGRLYAGQYGLEAGDGDVYAFDGTGWSLSFAGPGSGAGALAVYKGALYAGLGDDNAGEGEGDIYAFDGEAWRLEHDGAYSGVKSFAVYGGNLYAGQTGIPGAGDVLQFSPAAVSVLTGLEGSTGQETLSAVLQLAASTNTETCGGAAPCGATNQVVFNVTDQAGNVATAGPYAVRAAPPLSADDVVPARSTRVWYNTSTFTFTSGFVTAAYYRYVWNNSAAYDWTCDETLWVSSAAVLNAQALAGTATWYLHVLPYSVADSSGAGRDIGPFLFDGAKPAAASFLTFNSTGGVISEGMFNNLASGVTAQINAQDVLSGLSTAYYDPTALGLSNAAKGFEDGSLGGQWSTGGEAAWSVQTDTASSGSYAARAGAIDTGEETYMRFTADIGRDGEISFYRKVYNEYGDYLSFKIDGVEYGAWTGDVPWGKVGFPVTAGRHTFTWTYVKDMWSSLLPDTAWVDDIDYPSAGLLVQYSSTTGNYWATVRSSSPASPPYISLTGAEGAVSTQTFSVYGLELAYSTSIAVCGGAYPCDSTNQIGFVFSDMAGNTTTAGPYAILVDTVPTTAITDLSSAAVYYSSVTLIWTAPADTGPGVGAVTTGWYRIDYATYSGYEFSPSVYKVEFATQAVIGTAQTIPVEDLYPYTTHYFAVYAGDRAYNFSQLSNIVTVPPLAAAVDCGLRIYDGESVVSLACELSPASNSRLRIYNRGEIYGIILLDTDSPHGVSRMRIQTREGLKAVKKY